jgi:hypothetical protein
LTLPPGVGRNPWLILGSACPVGVCRTLRFWHRECGVGRPRRRTVVELRMLGPVGLWTAGGLVELGPARQRTALVALAVDAGRPVPVPVERLIDRVG